MPATATRPLILEDPGLLWLQLHGKNFGFEPDDEAYSLFEFITSAGHHFERAWIENEAPEAVQALQDDREVRQVQGLIRTIELMDRRYPVISHAALWWAPAKLYGAADLICLASWLYDKYPQLRPPRVRADDHMSWRTSSLAQSWTSQAKSSR